MLLNAAKRREETMGDESVAHYVFLGSDGWSGNMEISYGAERYLEGAITVQPASSVVKGQNKKSFLQIVLLLCSFGQRNDQKICIRSTSFRFFKNEF